MKKSKLRLITIGPVILFVILLVAFGALLAISIQTSNTNLRNTVREVSRPITSTSSKLLFNPVYTLNITEAENVISQFVDGEMIVYAAVFDVTALKLTEVAGEWIPEGDAIKSLSLTSINTHSTQEQEVGQYLLIVEPILTGSQVIGTVVYGFDRGVLQAGLEQAQFTLTIAILVALVVTSVLVYLLMRITLAPLTHLSNVAQRLGSGELSTPVTVEGFQEMASLAMALDGMRVALKESYSNRERRANELATVAEVSRRLSTILETDKLLQQVVDLTKERFDFYHTHIYLLNDAGDTLVLAAGAGEPGRQMVAEGRSISLDREQSLVARAARERKGVTVNDVTTAPDFLPHPLLPDTRSELAVPMLVGEEVVGVFDVQSDIVGRFTDADIAVQTTLASQIATSVQNSRSYIKARDAQQLTRSVIDSTDDWIFIKDQDHRYQLVNQGYANSLHIPIADFIGKDDLELGFPEELVKGNPEKGIRGFWADDRAVMDGGVPRQIPDDFVTIDGNIRVFDTVKVPLRDADNKVWGVLAFARDMTERRNLEELNRKRASQQEAINHMTQRIQNATTIEEAMQVAARELGRALGHKPTLVALDPAALAGAQKKAVIE